MKAGTQTTAPEQLILPFIIPSNDKDKSMDLTPKKRWATVKMMPKIYPGIVTESGLRWAIFNEFENGLYKCIRRMGGKLLIDLDDFEGWVDSNKREHYPGAKRPSWK
jgi:hypothetical protein